MKLKKLFFSILSVGILGLTSFSGAFNISSDGIDYLNSISLNSGSFTNAYLPLLYEIPNPSSDDIRNLCVVFKNFERSSDFGWGLRYADSVALSSNAPFYLTTSPYSLYCVSGRRGKFFINWNSSSNRVSTDQFWVFDSYNIGGLFGLTGTTVDCSEDSNYLQCLEDKNQLIGQVSTLSGSLNSCQSDLASCLNGVDVSYQACIENLSGCQSDLTNMTNYNESLSSQLNECLAELPVPCEGTGCEDTIITDQRFSFFWENNGQRFSLPVANNVFLPQGYRAYVDSGVVAISRIQEKSDPVLAEGSFTEVNSLFFHFFKSVIIVLFFALFLWFIKTLIYPLFIQNKKE